MVSVATGVLLFCCALPCEMGCKFRPQDVAVLSCWIVPPPRRFNGWILQRQWLLVLPNPGSHNLTSSALRYLTACGIERVWLSYDGVSLDQSHSLAGVCKRTHSDRPGILATACPMATVIL
eukprot:1155113-Amphidinium_carterae.1